MLWYLIYEHFWRKHFMLRTICAIGFAVLYLILGIPVLGIEYLIGKKNPHLRDISSLRLVQWAFRVINRICGVRLTVIGHENVPADQAVLYVANHNSYFDIIITYALCPGLTGYISKDTLGKVPLLNIWMSRLYCLFMNRDDMKQSLKVILQGAEPSFEQLDEYCRSELLGQSERSRRPVGF